MRLKKLISILLIIITMIFAIPTLSYAITITYTPLGVPHINSSFKTYMDFRTITNTYSNQYKFISSWGWTDEHGFMRCSGEQELGVIDDYYLVALGSYYGTAIGTKYRITTDSGKVFYVALGDCKDNKHTNATNQYIPFNNNVVEFIVDTKYLSKDIKRLGNANIHMPINGAITNIERMTFIPDNIDT